MGRVDWTLTAKTPSLGMEPWSVEFTPPRRRAPTVRVKRRTENCMGLVTAGAGIHFSAATSGCVQTAGVKMLSLQGDAPRLEVSIAWRRDDPSPVLRSFIEVAGIRA